jgi:hypothetical protein
VLEIRDVYPGSEFFHPGSRVRIKEFKYFFTPKNWFPSLRNFDPGCLSWIRILIFVIPGSRIQGSKRHRIPDPDPPQPKIVICFRTFTYCHRRAKWLIINRSNVINLTKNESTNIELTENYLKSFTSSPISVSVGFRNEHSNVGDKASITKNNAHNNYNSTVQGILINFMW